MCLGQYYDRRFQALPPEERDSKASDLQIIMINYFGNSLLYGSNFVYQSLPRLLSIWFDYGTRLLDVTQPKIREERKMNLLKMTHLIDNFLQKLPVYIFLTAFSQLVSRICHPQKEVRFLGNFFNSGRILSFIIFVLIWVIISLLGLHRA